MRLIDADALKERYENTTDCALVCIEEAPTIEIDYKPHTAGWLVHGQEPFVTWKCSNCGAIYDETYDYCPDCGSLMEG